MSHLPSDSRLEGEQEGENSSLSLSVDVSSLYRTSATSDQPVSPSFLSLQPVYRSATQIMHSHLEQQTNRGREFCNPIWNQTEVEEEEEEQEDEHQQEEQQSTSSHKELFVSSSFLPADEAESSSSAAAAMSPFSSSLFKRATSLPAVSLIPIRPLSVLPAHYDRAHSFVSNLTSAQSLLSALLQLFAASSYDDDSSFTTLALHQSTDNSSTNQVFPYPILTTLHSHYPCLLGSFTDAQHYTVSFAISLFASSAATQPVASIIVEVQKRSGDPYVFHHFYQLLTMYCTQMGYLSSYCVSHTAPALLHALPAAFLADHTGDAATTMDTQNNASAATSSKNTFDAPSMDDEMEDIALEQHVQRTMLAFTHSTDTHLICEALRHTIHTILHHNNQMNVEELLQLSLDSVLSIDTQQRLLAIQLLCTALPTLSAESAVNYHSTLTRLASMLVEQLLQIDVPIVRLTPFHHLYLQAVCHALCLLSFYSVQVLMEVSLQSGEQKKKQQQWGMTIGVTSSSSGEESGDVYGLIRQRYQLWKAEDNTISMDLQRTLAQLESVNSGNKVA